MRSSGASPSPRADRMAGATRPQRLAFDQDLARLRLVEPVDEAEELRAAGSDEPAETDDLAGVDLQAHSANCGQPPGIPNLQQHAVGADGPIRVELIDLASDHELDELVGRCRRGQAGGRRAPVGQHGDAVADAPDLVEAVRDVDDADALGSEPANDVEERLDLALVEDRRRLVHDQQPHVAGQRAGDRHDLLRRGPQLPDLRAHRDRVVAEPGEQSRRFPVHLVEVEQWPAARLVRQEDALGDAQVRDEVELLVDRRDAALERSGRVAGRKRLTREEDLAARRLERAGDALDERRLAGAVGAEQAVHLGLEHVEVDTLERLDPRELLDEVADLEDLRHWTTSPRRLLWAIRRPGFDQLGRAAPHRVLVLDRQDAVEPALVERVDVAAEVDLPEAGDAIPPPAHVPRVFLARRGPAEEAVAVALGRETSRRLSRGRARRGRRRAAERRPDRSPARAGARGRSSGRARARTSTPTARASRRGCPGSRPGCHPSMTQFSIIRRTPRSPA